MGFLERNPPRLPVKVAWGAVFAHYKNAMKKAGCKATVLKKGVVKYQIRKPDYSRNRTVLMGFWYS